MDPSLPASFPFSTPFAEGFLGPIVTVHKSVFLYDPLLVAAVLLLVFASGATAARRLALLCGGLAGFNILFFATYFSWHGGSSWANRFTTVPVDMVAMLAVPLLLQSRSELPAFARRAAVALAAVALAVQLCSVFFWYNLEVAQSGSEAAPAHILRRPANIARWIGGERSMPTDDGRAAPKRFGTPNFAPFLAADIIGSGPARVLQAVWCLGVLAAATTSVLAFAAAARGFPLSASGAIGQRSGP